ncbi:MAG: hypothetical protein AVO35_03225 [Candidatus Aegiribacteria sp. MLS_C]|nr:MAG: hypothetical protein AVO35_03225 [Candidatus Aegiribacteria sp. MLS_C]
MDDLAGRAAFCIRSMKDEGLDRAECVLRASRTHELNLDAGEISLLRTTEDISLSMTGILDGREGTTSINRTDDASILEAAAVTMLNACASEPDTANDISPAQPPASFDKGPEEPDLETMYDRMREFLDRTRRAYPSLILEQVILDFTSVRKHYANSNGVDLASRRGFYSFSPMFTSKEGADTSSFNYAGVSMSGLDRELHLYGTIDDRMRESTEQVRSREFSGKFTGDLLMTPECLEDFMDMTCMYLSDYPMIKGTSIFRDSLGTPVASPGLTVRSRPSWEGLAQGYFITPDGFTAGDTTIIEDGVLRSFMLSLYGSNKTGKDRSASSGGALVVEPGESSYRELVSSVKRGILICRFSGGMPSENGDFSGVAKNSYYMEDGKIAYPVREVMVSGNLRSLLKEIRGISRERVDSGDSIMPWVLAGGVTVFGK